MTICQGEPELRNFYVKHDSEGKKAEAGNKGNDLVSIPNWLFLRSHDLGIFKRNLSGLKENIAPS